MKIAGARITDYAIPFRQPLRAGGAVLRERRGSFLELRDGAGCIGIGEAALRPDARGNGLGGLGRDLRATCDALAGEAADLETLLRRAGRARYGATRAAVEMALYDLEAIARGVRVADLFGSARRTAVPVNALVGEDAVKDAEAAKRSGFTCVKLKIDGRDVGQGCARLRELRDAVGEAMRIRVDVNCGWSVGEAIEWIPHLAAYGVEYIEQPVASIGELARVRQAVGVPIAADECVKGEADVRAIAASGAADVIVVKPALVGIANAMAIVRAAAECGLDIVVTSTLDTSIGIAAALQLAATLPDPIRHCGLATAPLLAGDLVEEPVLPMRGFLRLPEAPGLGVHADGDSIERWQVGPVREAAVI